MPAYLIVIEVLLGVGILFCLAMIFVARRKKKMKDDKIDEEIPKSFQNTQAANSYFQEREIALKSKINAKRKALLDEALPLSQKIAQIYQDTEGIKYELTELHDEDFDELNKLYENYDPNAAAGEGLFADENYLALKKKCVEKNLPQILEYCTSREEICRLKKEIFPLKAQSDEWGDVLELRERDTWSSPEVKKYYDSFYALETNEQNLDVKQKRAQWETYCPILTDNSVFLVGKSSGPGNEIQSYQIARKENEVALRDTKTYEIRVLSLDDIMFVQMTEVQIPSYPTSKPSNFDIAMTEMVWGTAAATASAIRKNQASSVKTERRATIYFKYGLGIGPLHTVGSSALSDDAEKLIAMLPEKVK